MEHLIAQAARAGMEHAYRLSECTPCEIQWEMEAFAARRRQAAEDMDLLAWLTGRYVMTALHAPRRYPPRPDGILHRPKEMQQEDMKRVFRLIAERRENNGGC